jgi:hypothetical protein
MKPVLVILAGALVIAVILSLGVYTVFGDEPGYYFALLIALPAGLAGAGVLYLFYTVISKRRQNRGQ